MFDGLKDKLSKFRRDVEETAEEKAEEAAEAAEAADGETEADPVAAESDAAETADADAYSAATSSATEERDAAAESEAETVDADPAAPAVEDSADTAADEPVAEAEAATETEAATEVEPEAADEVETAAAADEAAEADEDDARSGPSAFKRAAAFATGKIIIEEEDLEEPLWELEMALLQSDVEMSVAEEILETVREKMIGETRKQVQTTGELVELALHDALVEVISVGQFDFDARIAEADKPVVIVFTGVNGVGKTTSIAKLSEYLGDRGYTSVLANGDTYRAGANEQLRKHAENVDRKIISHEQGGDPAAVIYDAVEYAAAHDIDVVLGDTAGRLHTSDDLMAQLAKIHRVVGPDMTLFVDEAVAGQDAVMRAREFNDAAEIDGTVLTKADADSSGGAAISISYVTGKPILFLGTGQGYNDLEPFIPEELVSQLLGEE